MNTLKRALFGAALAAISTEGLAAELDVDNQALVGGGFVDTSMATGCAWGGYTRLDVDSSNTDVIASAWVKGGPDEKHPLSSLLDETEKNNDKWYTNYTNEASVKVNFGLEARKIKKVAFKSANDVPDRDPTSVEIYNCPIKSCVLGRPEKWGDAVVKTLTWDDRW